MEIQRWELGCDLKAFRRPLTRLQILYNGEALGARSPNLYALRIRRITRIASNLPLSHCWGPKYIFSLHPFIPFIHCIVMSILFTCFPLSLKQL